MNYGNDCVMCDRLSSGQPYVTYRFYLYCNCIHTAHNSLSAQGVARVHILPVPISWVEKTKPNNVRAIDVCPDNVCPKISLLKVVQDISKGSLKGFKGSNPNREEITVFSRICLLHCRL